MITRTRKKATKKTTAKKATKKATTKKATAKKATTKKATKKVTTKKATAKKATTKKATTKKVTAKKAATVPKRKAATTAAKGKIPRGSSEKPKKVAVPKSRIPRGFEKIPGQEGARGLIGERLDDTKDRLAVVGLESRVYVHEYANGEVDGEIAVIVPRGKIAVEVCQDLEQAFQTMPQGLGNRFWFSLGIRLGYKRERDEERSGSARVRGMDDMQMYYRRMQTPKLIDSFLREQKIMIPGAEERYKRKIEIVYLRLNWNPDNDKPKR